MHSGASLNEIFNWLSTYKTSLNIQRTVFRSCWNTPRAMGKTNGYTSPDRTIENVAEGKVLLQVKVLKEDGNGRRYLVHFLLLMYGMAGWLGEIGIFVEFPLLIESAPEGPSLPSYVVILVPVSSTFPALYVLLKKFVPRYCNEFIWISGLLVIGFVSMGLLALFYDVTWTINGRNHSVVMLIIVFISSVVNSSSSIIFMPYLRNFDKKYLTSYFLGEGLSGTVPSIIALFQGVSSDSSCKTNSPNSTEPHVLNGLKPNFSPSIYFLIMCILLISCAGAFWLLEYLKERMFLEEGYNVRYYGQVPLTDDFTTANKPPDHDPNINAREIDELHIPSDGKTTVCTKNYLCVLLGLTCFVAHGILPGIQAYSCLSYGNVAYHLVATLTQFAGPAAYILGYCLPPLGVRGITWISVHALVLSTYITWLAISSPNPLWRDEIYGIVSLVTAWNLSFALISYIKLSIAAISRQNLGADGLYHTGISNRIGTVFGAIVSFVIVNYTTIFTAYSRCE